MWLSKSILAAATAARAFRAAPARMMSRVSRGGGRHYSVLEELRSEMDSRGLSAIVVPSDDPHLSEYVSPCFERRAFASGFTGSAGTAVITTDRALLWTDARYWLQAEQELSDEWTVMKLGGDNVPSVSAWLGKEVHGRIGIDAFVCSASFAKELRKENEHVEFSAKVGDNVVDAVWGSKRPPAPDGKIRVHPLEIAGEDVASKLERVRSQLKEKGAKSVVHVVASLDDVCWLFNIRGRDIECNQVALAYAAVSLDDAVLFCDESKIGDEVYQHLVDSGVKLAPYEDAVDYVMRLRENNALVWLDPDRCSEALVSTAKPHDDDDDDDAIVLERSPIVGMKAIKNKAEIAGMRAAHIRDGVAVAKAFCEIETKVRNGIRVDECDVDEALCRCRGLDETFLEPSFPTIAGSGSNGAIVHYTAEKSTANVVDTHHMLLVDSGGQYLDGTTDATRTMHFGEPTEDEIEAYTRVLKGNIAVDTAHFPENTPGFVLDAFARKSLWESGRDYGHGTGHGVGAALSVHEGPQSISPRFGNTQPLLAGMIVSNEPGYYEAGQFGIRIENLLLIERDPNNNFLRFERLTTIPIDTTCIDLKLLNEQEIEWINNYHQYVLQTLEPLLEDDPETTAWLKKKCKTIRC